MPTKCVRLSIGVLALLILSACQFGTVTPTPEQAIPSPSSSTTAAAPATPLPPQTLTVCLGEEPNTLYRYGDPNAAARSVLSAIYDGPVDVSSYEARAVILRKIPSLDDGDAMVETVSVATGDEVIDVTGTPITLSAGARIRLAGCRSEDCAVVYDGSSQVDMEQMIVSFTLLPGLYWSDGKPLTSADSVFAYTIAADPTAETSKYLTDRTQSYEATDDLNVQWWGKPGYIDPTFHDNFWSPLPAHLLSEYSADQVAEADVAARTPTGWGPYKIDDWKAGQEIVLSKSLFYFRSGEGLPAFDKLVFRVIPEPEAALSELLAGKCDLLDPSIRLDGVTGLLMELQQSGQIRTYYDQTMTLEQLAFGVRPASYDNGYVPGTKEDRPDLFADIRTRQAIAMCLDRQQVVDTVLYGLVDVPDTFVPETHPAYNPSAQVYDYDPVAAAQLLEQAGWRDQDNDASTPRQAWGVLNVPPGTPLVLNYHTTSATQRRQVSEILSQSLAACGIGVNLNHLPFDEFYAPGPEGVLFGRRFDLAQFAMGVPGAEPPCSWYLNSEVPAAANAWVGTNVSGHNNPTYDAACRAAGLALPAEPAYAQRYQDVQAMLAQDVYFVPLYFRLKAAASRPDLCNYDLGNSAETDLWSLEEVKVGTSCP